jgi:hypothetical protein
MGCRVRLRRVRLRRRSVHRRLRPWNAAVLCRRAADVQFERPVGCGSRLHESGVQRRGMHRGLLSSSEAMFEPHSADVRRDRKVGGRDGLRERVQRRSLLGDVHSGSEAVCWPDAADVRRDRHVAAPRLVHQPGVRGRRLHGGVFTRSRAVLEQRHRDLRGERYLGRSGSLCGLCVRRSHLHRRVRARRCSMFR